MLFITTTTSTPDHAPTTSGLVTDVVPVLVASESQTNVPNGNAKNMPNIRQNSACGNCDNLKRRLKFTVKNQVEMRRKHLQAIKLLRQKLKQSQPSVKRSNQTLKRKNMQIRDLKSKLQNNDAHVGKKLELLNTDYKKLKRNHMRLKTSKPADKSTSDSDTFVTSI